MQANRTLRWVGLLTMLGMVFWFGCAPDALSVKSLEVAPTGTPIEQSESIPVEIDIGDGEWATVSASRTGVEQAAWRWCDVVNEELGDQMLCPDLLGEDDFSTASVDAGGETCTDIGLCHLRRQLCAGAYLSELARSPLQRELSYGPEIAVPLADLGVSETEADSLDPTTPRLVTTPRIRFQPLTGPGRAAAVRGALNRYREAVRIARILQSHQCANTTKTCLQTFMERDASGPAPALPPYDDVPPADRPTWTDVFVQGYLDAVFEFSNNVARAVDNTRAAADGQISGKAPLSDEIATQWNGEHNSVAGAARLLGYGELSLLPVAAAATLPTCDGAQGLASKLNFDRIPVCPSIGTKQAVHTAINTIRQLRVSPNSTQMVDDVVAAYNADNMARGAITQPLAASQVLSNLGVSEADVSFAKTYLCQEAAAFGKTLSNGPEVNSVPRVFGTMSPTMPPQPEALAAHFLGTMDTGGVVAVDDDAYSAGGAIRTMDQMKLTTAALAATPGIETYLHSKLAESLSDAAVMLKASVGHVRLEFRVGPYSNPSEGQVESVEVKIHGIESSDRFYAVHGMGALKCVQTGEVDGAPCEPDTYAILLDTPRSALPAEMVDLSGETLTYTITSAARFPEGSPTDPIVDGESIYVLQDVSGAKKVLGGVVPKPGGQTIGGTSWTRMAMAPAGGFFENLLGKLVAAEPDDCSKPAATCAGLPARLVPPLESDINGQSTDPTTDTSFLHYLQMARAAADEADRRGLELLRSGLEMDERIETATNQMIELCGADADGKTGCGDGSGEVIPWATLGDRQACLWEVNGERCACPVVPENGICPVQCPLQLGSAEEHYTDPATLKDVCQALLTTATAGYEPIVPSPTVVAVPVLNTLNLAKSHEFIQPTACEAFDQLRKNDFPSDQARVDFIVNTLAPAWHKDKLQQIAKLLVYEEHLFDNYSLKYNNQTVFDTNRPFRPCPNDEVGPPCSVPEQQDVTGSSFWQTKVGCFISGEDTNCSKSEYGKDGCPLLLPNEKDFSMDTERAALTQRWGWGFGHLRRSVATLGVITGELSGMMHLARLHYATKRVWSNGMASVTHHKLKGSPCDHDSSTNVPTWVRTCDPWEDKDGASSFCVLANRSGYDAPSVARDLGHPVNFNGFLRNAIPEDKFWSYPMYDPCGALATTHSPLDYPKAVDPQFVYCNAPSPSVGEPPWDSGAEIWEGRTSGFIGSSATATAEFLPVEQDYFEAISDMWDQPDADICLKDADPQKPWKSAIWRAFCHAPEDAGLTIPTVADPAGMSPEQRVAFMSRGELPESERNTSFVPGTVIRQWVRATQDSKTLHYAQYLYDQSEKSVISGDRPFQYPLTARNIVDAMELACHASSVRRNSSLNCKTMKPEDIGTGAKLGQLDMTQLNGMLECYADWMAEIAGQTIVGPLPTEVVSAAADSRPLSGMTGLGGAYLDAMMAQHAALTAIAMDFDHLKDRHLGLAIKMRELQSIDRQEGYEVEKARAQQMATMYSTAAANVKAIADASSAGSLAEGLVKVGVAAELIYLQMETMKYELQGISAGLNSTQEGLDQQRLHVVDAAISEVNQGRDTAKALSTHINDLISASAKLEQIKLVAARTKATATFQDFVGDQPVHVNTVMRRTYNTNLIRYESALERAKKLAFIARRAIEVRFGVDMSTMADNMTLVDPPKDWASEVCNMQGINYADLRTGTPNGSTADFEFGKPPPAGDDFADDFIGDYVTKLEDFVNSYSFDYPLKDGDDIAVMSLAEDIWMLRASCVRPSNNLLYYSTEFDKRDGESLEEDSRGWFVDGCGEVLPAEEPGGETTEYRGCVVARPVGPAADTTDESGDAGAPDSGVDQAGLPVGAIVYRVGNRPCILAEPEFAGGVVDRCPEDSANEASGALVQRLLDLQPGAHLISLYLRSDPEAAPYGVDPDGGAGNGILGRVVRESDDFVVTSGGGAPSDAWSRVSLGFVADYGETYRLEVVPSTQAVPLDVTAEAGPSAWPGFLLSAAQVERVQQASDGSFGEPSHWEITDLRRNAPDPVCHERVGPEFRDRFERKCEYICPNGIQESCDDGSAALRQVCFYEGTFDINLESIERGDLIPSGQIAIGNFNFRHNLAGVNVVGTQVTSCDEVAGASCYGNGFTEYTLIHGGQAEVRNWEGGLLGVDMDTAYVEHGKALAAERTVTNPPSGADMGLLEPYMKGELKGRPLDGMYTIRIWESPTLKWTQVEDIQLVWKYHYWTRFSH